MTNQTITFETSRLVAALDTVTDAVVVLSKQGTTLYNNQQYVHLPEQFKTSLNDHVCSHNTTLSPFFDLMGYKIHVTEDTDSFTLVIDLSFSSQSLSVYTLRHLTNLLRESDNIYYAAAKAIQDSLGWRWVAITRFKGDEKLEVLSYLDNYVPIDNFEYDIVGTPCKTVIDTNRFTLFEDVTNAFPNYQALQDLGVKTYAGLIFKGPDGQPIGHIMAMHDQSDVNFAHAEEVINIATMALSSHFQLRIATAELEKVTVMANVDKLTGLGNRCAYERTLINIEQQHHKRRLDDWSIGIIDLDNLKALNDNRGHSAGDQFIKLMAVELEQLGRQTDLVFRIGGDEFALIFSQNATPFIDSVIQRFNKSIKRVSHLLNFPVGASIGFSALSETKGNIQNWVSLADKRMYQDKNAKKIKLG